jgi:biotin synthase-like enzyme
MADVPSKLNQSGTDNTGTHSRLNRSVILPEIEEFMFFVQANAILTGNYLKYIINDTNVMSDARRFGVSLSETIQRVVASCPK